MHILPSWKQGYISNRGTAEPVTLLLNLQIFDGHNGDAAAIYSRDNLLNHVLDAIPPGLPRDEWLQALPRAMVAGFVKTDKQFQIKGMKKFVSHHIQKSHVPSLSHQSYERTHNYFI